LKAALYALAPQNPKPTCVARVTGFVALSPGGRSNFTGTFSSTKKVLKNVFWLGWL
jgi:hypothetical protein